MAIKGELWTTKVILDKRSYFFNVKENRAGDVFLQVVESKKDSDDSRRAIVVFSEDMRKFTQGFDAALKFMDQNNKEKSKERFERQFLKKQEKDAKYSKHFDDDIDQREPATHLRGNHGIKKTGRLHVVSKRTAPQDDSQ